jgi:hypothetical protein
MLDIFVLKTLLLTCLLLLLWRTPPFFMQKISSIHENVQRLAADVPEVKIYIKSGLKSDRFRSKGGFSRLLMEYYMIELENTATFLNCFKSVAHAAALGSSSFLHELTPPLLMFQ